MCGNSRLCLELSLESEVEFMIEVPSMSQPQYSTDFSWVHLVDSAGTCRHEETETVGYEWPINALTGTYLVISLPIGTRQDGLP